MINRKNLIDFPNFIIYRFDSREFPKKHFLNISIVLLFNFCLASENNTANIFHYPGRDGTCLKLIF